MESLPLFPAGVLTRAITGVTAAVSGTVAVKRKEESIAACTPLTCTTEPSIGLMVPLTSTLARSARIAVLSSGAVMVMVGAPASCCTSTELVAVNPPVLAVAGAVGGGGPPGTSPTGGTGKGAGGAPRRPGAGGGR